MESMIVFYDGDCGLCNSFVVRLIKEDAKKKLRYSPLSGSTAAELVPVEWIKQNDTLVVYTEGQLFVKTEAVRKIYHFLKPKSMMTWVLKMTPLNVANLFYDFVAKRRNKLNKNSSTCVHMQENTSDLFLP